MVWKKYKWLLLLNFIVIVSAASMLALGTWRTAVLLMIALFITNMVLVYLNGRKGQASVPSNKHVKWIAALGIVFTLSGVIAVIKGIANGFSSDIRVGAVTVFLLGAIYLRLAWRAHRSVER